MNPINIKAQDYSFDWCSRVNRQYFSFVIIPFKKFQGHLVFDIPNTCSKAIKKRWHVKAGGQFTVKMKYKLIWICMMSPIVCMLMIKKNGPKTEP